MASYFAVGGDLSGTMPNPTVVRVNGATLTTNIGGSSIGVGGNNVTAINGATNVGIGSSASATNATVLGASATAAADGVALGHFAAANFAYSIAIGSGATSNAGLAGHEGVSIGRAATGTGIAIGAGSTATGPQSIAVGVDSNAFGGIVLGNQATCHSANSLAIGHFASTGTVVSGSAPIAIVTDFDGIAAGAPLAADHKLYIMINGVRYTIALTATP